MRSPQFVRWGGIDWYDVVNLEIRDTKFPVVTYRGTRCVEIDGEYLSVTMLQPHRIQVRAGTWLDVIL